MNECTSLGQWIALRRKSLRLRQADLARMAACAEITLRKIEADERRPSCQLAEALTKHLAVSTQEEALFLQVALGERRVWDLPSPELPAVPRVPAITQQKRDNLPVPPTPLIGRENELALLLNELSQPDVRLLTLTGAPGIGKTRLATELAIQARNDNHYSGGVWFVSLAAITDSTQLVPAITQTLSQAVGIPISIDTLRHYLSERHLLLFLDNLEQLIDAAGEIADLLTHAPKLTVLATSRAPLHVLAEHVYLVPPLRYPEANAKSIHGNYVKYPAVVLFSQRAKAAQHTFTLNEQNMDDVIEICRRLSGLPLAIELAAARIQLFNPRMLLAHLSATNGSYAGGSLDLLTAGMQDLPARQQTLRNAIAWSYELLTSSQQRLLRTMSVFAGGCTLEAAQFVADNPPTFLSDLQTLLNHSLIQFQNMDDLEPRYILLEMIKAFAREQLDQHGESHATHERYLDHYIAILNSEPAYDGKLPDQPGVWPGYISRARHDHFITTVNYIKRLVPERDNLLAGLQWSLREDQSPQKGVDLVLSMYHAWWNLSPDNSPEQWIKLALRHVPANPPNTKYGRLLCEWAYVLFNQGLTAKARALTQESLNIHKFLQDDMDILSSLHAIAEFEIDLGMDDEASAHLKECIDLALAMTKERYAGYAMFLLSRIAIQHQNYEKAQQEFDRCLAHFPHEDERDVVALYHELGSIACIQGDYDRAVAMHTKSLELWRSVQGYSLVCMAQRGLGDVALFRGDLAQAKSIFEETLMLSFEAGWLVQMLMGIYGLAATLGAEGHFHNAITLWAAAESAHSALGNPRRPLRYDDYLTFIDKARTSLKPADASKAEAQGRAMALEPAVQYALEICVSSS
jgi:predicted ATPase/DNA-binding XRE family transcriptional regulator/predicted negative regulator of RcsB-dependent stress response